LAYRALERSQAREVGRILWNQVRGSLLIELMAIAQICRHDRAAARERLDRLLQTWPYGQFLSREILVLVTGPPNVGKSSLINALIGYQRAVVSPVPGTTRDLVGQSTAFSGWPFRLLDSAGLRTTDDALELQGIDRARRAVGQVDLVIQLRAVDQDPTDWVEPDPLPPHVACLTVLNKVDLLEPSSDLGPDTGSDIGSDSGSDIDMGSVSDQRLLADSEPGGCFAGLRVSTVTGHGLSELARAIVVTVLPAESGASQPEGGPDSHLEPTPIGGLVHDEPEAEVEAGVVFAPEIRRWLIQWRECLTNLLQETSP
jgi:tRNA modification GTPase